MKVSILLCVFACVSYASAAPIEEKEPTDESAPEALVEEKEPTMATCPELNDEKPKPKVKKPCGKLGPVVKVDRTKPSNSAPLPTAVAKAIEAAEAVANQKKGGEKCGGACSCNPKSCDKCGGANCDCGAQKCGCHAPEDDHKCTSDCKH